MHGHYWPDVLPGIIVMSLGMGFTFVPVTLIATTNIDQGDAGLASGIFNTSQQIGGAVGLAVLSTFFINTSTNYLAELGHRPTAADQAQAQVNGYSVAFTIGAGFMLAAAVLIGVLVRKSDVAQIAENPRSRSCVRPAMAAEGARDEALRRIRAVCLALPEVTERPSHGAPTFFVRGKRSFAMVLTNHHGDGRFAIWCAAPDGRATPARRGRAGALLRPALRRAPRLARRPPRPRHRLGGDRRHPRGRLRRDRTAEAPRSRRSAPAAATPTRRPRTLLPRLPLERRRTAHGLRARPRG